MKDRKAMSNPKKAHTSVIPNTSAKSSKSANREKPEKHATPVPVQESKSIKTNPNDVAIEPTVKPVDGPKSDRPVKRVVEPQSAITYFDEKQLSVNMFRGFVHLSVLAGVVFIITHTVVNYYEHGYVFDVSVFHFTFGDIFHTLLAFLVMLAFSTSTYFLEVFTLYVKIPRLLLRLVHHTVLLIFLLAVLFEIFRRETPFVASIFLCMETIVLGMKMHSYFAVNRDLSDNNFPGVVSIPYPKNVSLFDYLLYMAMPTLIYRPSYPRTPSIRMQYLLERFFACLFILLIMSITISEYINPVLGQQESMNPIHAIAKLAMPMMVIHLCMFFMIFEVILNGFAEVTFFADRYFYSDWWNSTSFEEYARKWNKPVHNWLLEHIYNESIEKIRLSKTSAMWATFLFSAMLHELVLTVGFRVVHLYLFLMQMSQIPLIWLGRQPFMRGTILGNLFFWFGLFFGPPILTILYVREHVAQQSGGVL